MLFTSALGNLEWCLGQINSNHFAAARRQRHCDITRSGGNLQRALIASRSNGGHQACEAIVVGNCRTGGISIGLTSKFLANNIFVINHTHAVFRACAPALNLAGARYIEAYAGLNLTNVCSGVTSSKQAVTGMPIFIWSGAASRLVFTRGLSSISTTASTYGLSANERVEAGPTKV